MWPRPSQSRCLDADPEVQSEPDRTPNMAEGYFLAFVDTYLYFLLQGQFPVAPNKS